MNVMTLFLMLCLFLQIQLGFRGMNLCLANRIFSIHLLVEPPENFYSSSTYKEIMKQFAKALDQDGDCFKYLNIKFPAITIGKIKAGIFHGSQIRKLLKDHNFVTKMKPDEFDTWNSFADVVSNFLGNHKAKNYEDLIEKLLISYKKILVQYKSKSFLSLTVTFTIFQKILEL